MRTGRLHMRIFSNPRPYAYGDPHMRTAIPICKISHMGKKILFSHMGTNSLCIRLVTEQSPVRIRGYIKSPYACGGEYYLIW